MLDDRPTHLPAASDWGQKPAGFWEAADQPGSFSNFRKTWRRRRKSGDAPAGVTIADALLETRRNSKVERM